MVNYLLTALLTVVVALFRSERNPFNWEVVLISSSNIRPSENYTVYKHRYTGRVVKVCKSV